MKIAAIKIEMWPIGRPIPYERNARKLSPKAIAKVAASLTEFGWRQPIVVDSGGVVIAGHTRLLAAKQLGLPEIPVHVARELSPAQVKAYRLMDNRTHDESGWDNDLLGPEFFDLRAMKFDLDLTGFDHGEAMKIVFGEFDHPGAQLVTEADAAPVAATTERGLEFRVIVECSGEAHQTKLLDRFKQDGLKCKALIS